MMTATAAAFLSLLLAGPSAEPWNAVVCLSGRFDPPRIYASSCVQERLDPEAFCSNFKTRFALRIERTSSHDCTYAVGQNLRDGCALSEGLVAIACEQ